MFIKKKVLSKSTFSYELYNLYIKTLIGKLIKKGGKFRSLKIFKKIKENIKLQTNKKTKISFILYLAMLNSLTKVSFKEIRMGSQKKQVPIPIFQEKQILVSVATLLNYSKNNKFLQLDKLVDYLILLSNNQGLLIKNKKDKYRKAIINKMLLRSFKYKKKRKKKGRIEKLYYASQKNYFQIYKNKTPL